ncbi:cytochrome P450 10-like [Clavelina lepadiformis]|uniref:cytochrome P450 10-like n=1 Tax=Clavelina lepadiformis TaxID=159417 RepID=UPI0040422FF3
MYLKVMRAITRELSSCPARSPRNTSSSKRHKVRAKAKPVAPFSDVPEPKGLPLIGTALDYTRWRNFDASYLGEHWNKRHQDLGSIYKENIIPGITEYIVYTSSPKDTEIMLRSEDQYPQRDPLGPIQEIRLKLGEHQGLINANGEEWYNLRRIVNQHFLSNSIIWLFSQRQYDVARDFADYVERNLNEASEVPDFAEALNKWACESTGVFAFDIRLGAFHDALDPELQQIIKCNRTMFECMGRLMYGLPWWKYFNTKDMQDLYEAHRGQVESTKRHMNRILKHTEPKDGLYTKFIFHNDQLTAREKLMLMTEFFVAGIDTTSNSAIFFLYALALDQEKQEKLRKEIFSVVDEYGVNGQSINKMNYLHACVRETQRMFPFVNSLTRRYSKDIILSGYRVPAGTHILNTSNMVNSRNVDYFHEPDTFLPERWLAPVSVEKRRNTRFVMSGPFGIGLRMCPGRKFATQELKLLAIAMLMKYRIEYNKEPIKVAFRLVSFPSQKPQFNFYPITQR